ncbi:MAG: hypothetical protein F6J93_02800 [Oscillatoria sp. SIO1A7]|nr:hypothetical protein [Oscillatoria sp. SIO1A7]
MYLGFWQQRQRSPFPILSPEPASVCSFQMKERSQSPDRRMGDTSCPWTCLETCDRPGRTGCREFSEP